MTDVQDTPPTNTYQAADWIVKRHPWAREMAERVVGPIGERYPGEWLDDLAQAVLDSAAHGEEWKQYESRHRPPDDGAAYEAWLDAGPQPTPGAAAYGPMSSGERRIVRLIATLANNGVPWSVTDISFDQSGARILLDWMAVCRAQLPEELYEPQVRLTRPGMVGRLRARGGALVSTSETRYALEIQPKNPGFIHDQVITQHLGTDIDLDMAAGMATGLQARGYDVTLVSETTTTTEVKP